MSDQMMGSTGSWRRAGRFIVLSESELALEQEEVKRSVQARVEWKGPLRIAQAMQEPGGGVYFIQARGSACYAGQTDSFRTRIATHVRTKRCPFAPPSQWLIWVGRVQSLAGGASPMSASAQRTLRLGVEHAVIRNVLRPHQPPVVTTQCVRGGPLVNRSSICPFRITAGGLRVENVGNLPLFRAASGGSGGTIGDPGPRPGTRIIAGNPGSLYES